MNWLPINEIDGQIGDGERIVVLMNTPEGWPWLCIFQAMAIGDSVSFVCTEDSPSLLCDGKGWLPEGAVAKHLSGEILDDSDGIPVCADCMNEPCQCEITPPSDGANGDYKWVPIGLNWCAYLGMKQIATVFLDNHSYRWADGKNHREGFGSAKEAMDDFDSFFRSPSIEPDWRIETYSGLLRDIGKLVGVSNLDERLPIAVADALKSSTSIESSLAEAINHLFTLNDTVSIVSYDAPDGSKTLYRIEDEIGDYLTDGHDTWQAAVLATNLERTDR